MFEMTFNEAMTIQRSQMVWYRHSIGRAGIKAIKRSTIFPPDIRPDEPMPVHKINELVPRGGSFESHIKRNPARQDPLALYWVRAVRRGLV